MLCGDTVLSGQHLGRQHASACTQGHAAGLAARLPNKRIFDPLTVLQLQPSIKQILLLTHAGHPQRLGCHLPVYPVHL